MTDCGEVEPRVFKIKLPMRIQTSSKKKQALNLNVYRNLHFRSLSSQKNKFYKIAKKLLLGLPPLGVITLHYDVCPTSMRRLDIMNVGSIVDKYFSDTLTESGIIVDDDYVNIPKVSFAFGGLVKSEHVLVTITEIEPRKEAMPMRVLLDDHDILSALTTYVDTLNLPNASGVEIDITDGVLTAEIMFQLTTDPDTPSVDETVPQETKPARRKRRTKAEMAADAAAATKTEDTANVDEAAATSPDSGDGGTAPAAEVETETPTAEEVASAIPTKVTSKGNLFGDKESPSSEGDGEQAKAVLDTPPAVTPAKGSIFDT